MKGNREDAFGQMLVDASRGIEIPEIIERDDYYITSGLPMTRYLGNYSDWPMVQRRAIRFARGRVLDVGCGAGRHSLYLQEKGFDVLGLDSSPKAIEVCKQRGLKQAVVMSIGQISLKLGKFDTLLLLGNNFGLLENRERASRILTRFYRVTSARGRILAQSSERHNTDDPDELDYQERNMLKGRMPGQVRMRVRYKSLMSPWFDYLLVSKEEMNGTLKGTGWVVKRFLEIDVWSYVAIIEKSKQD